MTGDVLPRELFDRFARLAYERAGIRLRPGKESLVAARVGRRMRALDLTDVAHYARVLEGDTSGGEMINFLDAISTNVTSFFREVRHFELLEELAKQRRDEGRRRMRFWCAACSTGEEPYTLAMVLDDVLGVAVDWRILATDISVGALERAERATYSDKIVEAVPPKYRTRYLTRSGGGDEITWEVAAALRDRVVFRRINLAEPPYPMPGPLDVILCRNVMIYFDDRVRAGIVAEAERLLAPGGWFITSHTETLASLKTELRPRGPSVYTKAGAP